MKKKVTKPKELKKLPIKTTEASWSKWLQDNHIDPVTPINENHPRWLQNTKTENAEFYICHKTHKFIWIGGTYKGTWPPCRSYDDPSYYCEWINGTFAGDSFNGHWRDGSFLGKHFVGEWSAGTFHTGNFNGGTFTRGSFGIEDATEQPKFLGGNFLGGQFNGIFVDGSFQERMRQTVFSTSSVWENKTLNKKLTLAALVGIYFDSKGFGVAYRKTRAGGRGCWSKNYVQKSGKFEIEDAAPEGSGTCKPGIHVCGPLMVLDYFAPYTGDILWQIKFHIDDFLDCDGQKARIRKGTAKKVPWNFLTNQHSINLNFTRFPYDGYSK